MGLTKRRDYALAFFAAILVYFLDRANFFALTVWIGYFLIPLFLTRRSDRTFLTIFAAVSSLFILLGYYSGSHEFKFEPGLYNRILGIVVLWLMCLLLSRDEEWQPVDNDAQIFKDMLPDASRGYARFEIISPETEGNFEFCFRYVNRNFEKMTGLQRDKIVGTLLSRVLSDENPLWIPLFSAVALTGKSLQFECHSSALSKNLEVVIYRPQKGELAVVVTTTADFSNSTTTYSDQKNLARGKFDAVDIDVVKRMEKESAQLKGQLQTLIGSLHQGLVHLDRHGQIIAINPAAERILGVSAGSVLGKKLIDADIHFLHEDGSPILPQEFSDTLAQFSGVIQHDVVMEVYHPKSKEYRTVVVSALPLLTEDGQRSTEIMTLLTDITKQRILENDLKHQVDRFRTVSAARDHEQRTSDEMSRTIVETAQEGIWLIDYRGMTLFVTIRMAAMLGYTINEMLGQHFSEFTDASERSRVECWLQQCSNGKIEQDEVRLRRKNGTVLWCFVAINPFNDGKGRSLGILAMVTDITERKQALTALRESELRYRAFFTSISDALFIHHVNDDGTCGCFIEVNDIACVSLGYTREELLAKTPLDILLDDAGTTMVHLVKRLIAGRQLIFEQTYISKDNRFIPVEINARTFMVDGKLAVLSLVRDISERRQVIQTLQESHREMEQHVRERTAELSKSIESLKLEILERKQAQEALDKASRELEDFYHNSPCGYHSLNETGLIVKINDTELAWLGYSRDEIVGKKRFEDLLSRESAGVFGGYYSSVEIKKEIHDLEIELIRKDGTILPALLNSSVIRDHNGNFLVIHSFLCDLTDRNLAQQRIESLTRLHTMMRETAKIMVNCQDQPDLFARICRTTVEQGGFVMSWVGLLNTLTDVIEPVASFGIEEENLQIILDNINYESGCLPSLKSAIRDGDGFISNDIITSKRTESVNNGTAQTLLPAVAIIPLSLCGKPFGALAVYSGHKGFFDRHMVELLSQMGDNLSFVLENLERERFRRQKEQTLLQETLDKLSSLEKLRDKELMLIQQSRLAAMGEMIGSIAHQWRQPLTMLSVAVQDMPLVYDLGEFSREYLDDQVKKVVRLVERMSGTIDDFRHFFRPDKNRETFSMNEVVTKTLSLVEASFIEKRITINVTNEALLHIDGYANEFSQALLNILINARDAFETVQGGERAVRIRLFQEGNTAIITVTDTAGGISPDIINRVFDPYFSMKIADKGTGLGLFIAKTIIEKSMNGHLSVRNVIDGAEFKIEV